MRGKRYVVLMALLTFVAMGMNARTFEQGEKIYVNADQTFHDGCFNWANDNAKISLYVWKQGVNNSEKWVTLAVEAGYLYSGDMPAGDFDRCIIVRGSQAATWDADKKWNQTGNLTIPDATDRNYISKFWVGTGDASADWLTYSPAADKIAALASAVTEEHIKVCTNALGCLYSLHPRLKSDKSDYDYDNVTCHSWYVSTDKSTWSSIDGLAGLHNGELHKDTFYILPSTLPSNVIYFYLHSSKQAGRRLIKLTTDATGCDLDCTITAFEVACSEVNANDTTYTLDGMVAFGEPNGNLIIECDGKSTTITNAKSPQIFSITGLQATTKSGQTTTATARFVGNNACTKSATVHIPNATQGITSKHLDVLTGETIALNPTGANYTNEHKWYVDGVEQPSMQGAQTSIAQNQSNTTRYTYREFNPPAGDMSDMMSNGGYEDDFNYGTVGGTSTISDYNYWDKHPNASTQVDYYATHSGANNGFAVVQNANNFAPSYAKVTAREGDFFALFDAASDGVAGKKAWYATTANNPNLKLQKGTTYLFSFWAANINNYGEMDNAAKLQFQIEHNGKTDTLGYVLDLNSAEFRNNRWHQCSATFYADADATDVTISVVNLNRNTLNTGNDFALDDIQFRAVSSATRSVKIQQIFEVQTHEPQITSLTIASQSLGCDSTAYKATLNVTYANPKGKLVIEDLTTGATVHEQTMPAIADGDWDKPKKYSVSLRVAEDAIHTYHAYFAGWPEAEATASSVVPPFESCCIEGVMFRKWQNVIFINNYGNVYTSYQWYKDGKPMPGETQQRYYAGVGVDLEKDITAQYHCVMQRTDGTTETTCPHIFKDIPRSAEAAIDMLLDGVSVYPTAVASGATITIRKTTTGTLQATLLTLTGQTISTIKINGESRLTMPAEAGMYLIRLQSPETQRTIKIHVY